MIVKKMNLLLALFICTITVRSQQKMITGNAGTTAIYTEKPCNTAVPSAEWDEMFNKKVEEYTKKNASSKILSTYTIPVIVHILHRAGYPVGLFENISQNQVTSQITVLNDAFAGKNNISIPGFFQSLNAGNIGIQFCLVNKDPNGNTLVEPGIERIDCSAKGWRNLSTLVSDTVSNYIEKIIKPATIWNPEKYLNIWVTDLDPSKGFGSYAKFPVLTGLSGLTLYDSETATNSGIVFYHKMFGTTGSNVAPYTKGMTAVHEVGHYLGLRHIWGDTPACGNDFCSDTPPHTGGFNNAGNGSNRGCPTAGWKGQNGLCLANNYGEEMFMNHMDYTDDDCKGIFTAEQKLRMITAMTYGKFRKFLGMDGFCNTTPQAPIANFVYPLNLCNDSKGIIFNDASQNLATSWNWSVNPQAGVTISSSTAQNPVIKFTSPGTYNITLKAGNNMGSSTETKSIVINDCIEFNCDTLKNDINFNLNSVGTWYWDNASPRDSNYLSGTNYRQDKAFAELYTNNSNFKKLRGLNIMIGELFNNSITPVVFNVWADANGKPGAILASQAVPMNKLGAINVNNFIEFATPINVTGKFYVGFEVPVSSSSKDLLGVTGQFKSTGVANTSWIKDKNDQWISFTQLLNSMGSNMYYNSVIFPILCEGAFTVGLSEKNSLEVASFYPNPSNGKLQVQFANAKDEEILFSVYNTLGEKVFQGKSNTNGTTELQMDLSNLQNGIYYIHLNEINSKNSSVLKVLFQH